MTKKEQELDVFVRSILLAWIDHNSNWNDRVVSRDILNSCARQFFGEADYEMHVERVRRRCREQDKARAEGRL
jgi:hypothetical protein